MGTAVVDAGILNQHLNVAGTTGGITGGGILLGTSGTNVIVDANVNANSNIYVTPTEATAGLLIRTKTWWIVPTAGSFTFFISATSAGAPAGTEQFMWQQITTLP